MYFVVSSYILRSTIMLFWAMHACSFACLCACANTQTRTRQRAGPALNQNGLDFFYISCKSCGASLCIWYMLGPNDAGRGSEEDKRRGLDLVLALTNPEEISGRDNDPNPRARTTRIHESKRTTRIHERI